jgi:hypothetical protein
VPPAKRSDSHLRGDCHFCTGIKKKEWGKIPIFQRKDHQTFSKSSSVILPRIVWLHDTFRRQIGSAGSKPLAGKDIALSRNPLDLVKYSADEHGSLDALINGVSRYQPLLSPASLSACTSAAVVSLSAFTSAVAVSLPALLALAISSLSTLSLPLVDSFVKKMLSAISCNFSAALFENIPTSPARPMKPKGLVASTVALGENNPPRITK